MAPYVITDDGSVSPAMRTGNALYNQQSSGIISFSLEASKQAHF